MSEEVNMHLSGEIPPGDLGPRGRGRLGMWKYGTEILLCAPLQVPALAAQTPARPCRANFAFMRLLPAGHHDPAELIFHATKAQNMCWYKKGQKKFAGICVNLIRPNYVIVWPVNIKKGTTWEQLWRTVHTTGTIQYDETGDTTTLDAKTSVPQTVPVETKTTSCTVFVLRSPDGKPIQQDMKHGIKPILLFQSTSSRRHTDYQDCPSILGQMIISAIRGDRTQRAFQDAVKFIAQDAGVQR